MTEQSKSTENFEYAIFHADLKLQTFTPTSTACISFLILKTNNIMN